MTPRQPKPPPESEAELFEQWSVLDRLVERQAAQLRAGIQDAEDVDEPAPDAVQSAAQQREIVRLRDELRQAVAARDQALGAARVACEGERRWQERAEAAELRLREAPPDQGSEIASLQRRLEEMEAAMRRAEAGHGEMLEALRGAHLEVESLRLQLAEAHRGFWHRGRR